MRTTFAPKAVSQWMGTMQGVYRDATRTRRRNRILIGSLGFWLAYIFIVGLVYLGLYAIFGALYIAVPLALWVLQFGLWLVELILYPFGYLAMRLRKGYQRWVALYW